MESQLTPPADENFANTNQLFTSIHTDIFGQDLRIVVEIKINMC